MSVADLFPAVSALRARYAKIATEVFLFIFPDVCAAASFLKATSRFILGTTAVWQGLCAPSGVFGAKDSHVLLVAPNSAVNLGNFLARSFISAKAGLFLAGVVALSISQKKRFAWYVICPTIALCSVGS